MSVTAKRLFYGAYRDARLIPLEQSVLSPDQEEEARQLYNRMVDALNGDGLTVSHVARTLFDITSSTGDYTIGPGATWDTPLPQTIERAGVVTADDVETPLTPLTLQDYQEWRTKTQTADRPFSFYYEKSAPTGIVHLVEIPSSSLQAALYLESPLSQIDAAGDYSAVSLDFRYGYQEMLESNLAVRLPGGNPTELVIRRATSTLAQLMGANHRPLARTSDMMSVRGGRSNVYLGTR